MLPSSSAKAGARAPRSANAPSPTSPPGPAKIEALRQLLRNQPPVSPDQVFAIARSLPHGHVELLLEAFRRLRLPALLDRRPSRQRGCVLAMIAQRLLHPVSKLATTRLWHACTLAQELALLDADEDDLYDAMDWLFQRQPRIEKRLAQRHLGEDDQVLYDVSSSYSEGRTCPLMQFAYDLFSRGNFSLAAYATST